MIRIIVVDDQAMVRGALAALLDLESDIEVVGQAASGTEALDVIAHLARTGVDVDVALLDVEMPHLDGIGTARRITNEYPSTRSLIVTTFGRPGYVQRAIHAGASGFIVKDTPPAAAVHLSTGTVRNHVSSAMAKTNARTRAEAAHIAKENGWL